MKNIKVLGADCANCNATMKLIEETAKAKGVKIQLEKVEDMAAILGYGVMSTPGVVIDGKVVHDGGVPGKSVVEGWLGSADTLEIEWRHLVEQGNTCERCDSTGETLRQVLQGLSAELVREGVVVTFRETPLGPEALTQSNLILLNGKPMEDWLGAEVTETHCQSCCELVGEEVSCRAVEVNGKVYEAIPEALIREAAHAALKMESKA